VRQFRCSHQLDLIDLATYVLDDPGRPLLWSALGVSPSFANPTARALAGVSRELQVLLPIEGLVDLDALRGRLEKDIAKAQKEIQGLSGRLANPNFADKAPPAVVAECRANLAEAEAQAQLARQRLADLG
jgi:valyl-tRNA synthetase